ncbi:MAG: BrxA family protein [Candidatus Nanopelagicales bacterium]|nr:BrxA family protein [Candidatus Nanopelagicales bacterium]
MGELTASQPRYRLAFSVGGLFSNESVVAAALFLERRDWASVRAAIDAHNLLRARTVASGKRQSREVVINAIVHASYSERGTPIRVGFYDDRIVVESPGGLVSGLTVATMRGVSRLRNPLVARIFRDAGLIEQWGSGVNRVYDELAKAELPEPDIEEIVDRVRVMIHVGHRSATAPPDEQVSKSSEQVTTILRAASSGERTRKELLAAIGLADAYGNYRRHLMPLIESALLARTIPDKPNSRLQRIRHLGRWSAGAGSGRFMSEVSAVRLHMLRRLDDRRVVFWHDPQGQHAKFDALADIDYDSKNWNESKRHTEARDG